MAKIKKIVTVSTIVSTIITSLVLILLVFDTKLFGKVNGDMLITFACLGIGGFFAINSINMLTKNRIIGLVSLGLIVASVFMIILSTWLNFGDETFLKITISLGFLSLLFNIIVSSGLDLGRSKLFWQIMVYFIVFLTDVIITLVIFGAINILYVLPWLLTLIILSIVGVIILKVLAKRSVSNVIVENKDMISIPKSEYALLKEKAQKYDELMKTQDNQ